MALPILALPEFTDTIPSTGENIRYRPFVVKEEKLLYMALEGKSHDEMYRAIVKILNNCLLGNVDVGKLTSFDIEYLFLKLRGKSVGEVIDLKIRHGVDDECKHATEVKLNIDDIKVVGTISDGKIMINDMVGVKLRYPSIQDATTKTNKKDSFAQIVDFIEYVYDINNVYNDFTKEEMEEWLGNLNEEQYTRIIDFFRNTPVLAHEFSWTCPKCNKQDKVLIKGLENFFG